MRKFVLQTTIVALATALLALGPLAGRALTAQQAEPIVLSFGDQPAAADALALDAGRVALRPLVFAEPAKTEPNAEAEAEPKAASPVTIRLETTGKGDAPTTTTATIALEQMAPASAFSRMMPMPTRCWEETVQITFAPGETTELTWQPELAMTPGMTYRPILIADGKTALLAFAPNGEVQSEPLVKLPAELQGTLQQASQ